MGEEEPVVWRAHPTVAEEAVLGGHMADLWYTGNGAETRWAVFALRAEYPSAHGQAGSYAAAKQQAETALRAAR